MKKILVCVKQVPDMESRFTVTASSDWYDESDLAFRLNEYDEFAVEEAVRLKESLGGEPDVTVISIGPDRVKETIKKALAMGCDRGVHVALDEPHRLDPFEIAAALSAFAGDKAFDLIFTGLLSQDRGSAQVGGLIAEALNYPLLSTVVDFSYDNGVIEAKSELEGGHKAKFQVNVPAVVACQLGLNKPRYPTLPNIMKAKKKEMVTIPVDDLMKGTKMAETVRVFVPEKKGAGLVLEGDPAEIADRIISVMREKTTVLP